MQRVVVVGGGVSGLSVAYGLQERLPRTAVVVLEQRPQAGGTLRTLHRDGFTVEAGPNGFPDNNPSTLALARRLDLGGRLVAASEEAGRNRFLLLGGRLRQLPSSLRSLLASDLLSWRAKYRIFTERFRRPRLAGADESIDAFARRRLGGEIADTLVDAFVTGILAGDPKLLSVRAAFPRLAGWERDHGSVLRGMAHARRSRGAAARGTMWSFREGLQTLVDALSAHLTTPPLVGVSVRRVHREGSGWRVEADGFDTWTADAVVLCCPAYVQATLVADLDPVLAELIGGIAYNRVAVVALGFRRQDVPHPLDGFGYLSPQRARRDVLGVQWCSSIFPDRAPPGMVLLRAICGGWHRGEVVDWEDARLIAAVGDELRLAVGVAEAPRFAEVIRWERAIPQYGLGHLERVADVERRLETHPGLFVGGNPYHGVSINDCVEQADLLAGRVADALRRGQPDGEE